LGDYVLIHDRYGVLVLIGKEPAALACHAIGECWQLGIAKAAPLGPAVVCILSLSSKFFAVYFICMFFINLRK
jgi:hypothetical protein